MASMTVGSIIDRVRDSVNEVSLTTGYWIDAYLFNYLADGQVMMAQETGCLQIRKTIFTTVSNTRTYSLTTGLIRIESLQYAGGKVQEIDPFSDENLVTNRMGPYASITGTPNYYWIYGQAGGNGVMEFEPIPNDATAVVAYAVFEPSITAGSYTTGTALEIPSEYGPILERYVLARAWGKENNPEAMNKAQLWYQRWLEGLKWVKSLHRQKLDSDRHKAVKNIDQYFNTNFGIM